MARPLGIHGCILMLLLSPSLHAQVPAPHERPADDRTIDELRFDEPATVEGNLLLLDTYDDAIWIRLTRVYEEMRWIPVPHQVELLVYARDSAMMNFFRKLPAGTVLRMTIQIGVDGKRRILTLEET